MLKAIKMHLQRPQKTFLVKNYTILLERSTVCYRLYILYIPVLFSYRFFNAKIALDYRSRVISGSDGDSYIIIELVWAL